MGYNLHPLEVLLPIFYLKSLYMLKLAPVFFILAIVLGVYSLTATSVVPKVLLFTASMLLFISLLGKKRVA
jgi:hypothetical protein